MFSGFYLFIPPPVPSSSRVFEIRVLGDLIHPPSGLILNIRNSIFLIW